MLTLVTGPTCPPCAATHETLRQWLTHRDDLQVQVVFSVPDDLTDLRTQVAAHLLALHRHDPPAAEAALHDWYANQQQPYTPWVARHPAAAEVAGLAPHHAWCQQAGAASTPTILLNGRELPSPYRLEDIQYLL